MRDFEKITTGMGEECGVFGAYDIDGEDVAASIYYGLFALQHRGQESCGIAVTDTYGQRKVSSKKGLGYVKDVFDEETLESLKGNLGVGHVRYSTAGATLVENAQPLVINYVKGTLAIAPALLIPQDDELYYLLPLESEKLFASDNRCRSYGCFLQTAYHSENPLP